MSNKSTNEKVAQEIQAQEIIRDHVMYSMGSSLVLIPAPLLDIAAVTAIQLEMVKQLAKLYNVDYKESSGKALVGALTGNILKRVAASFFKSIPGIGWALGGVSSVVLAGAATYALGDVFAQHARDGGSFKDIDLEQMKQYYKERYEEGKEKAKAWKKEVEEELKEVEIEIQEVAENIKENIQDGGKDEQSIALQKLKELGELKEKGVISAQEFTAMKKQIKEEFKDAGKAAPKAKRKAPAKKPTARKKPAPKKKTDSDEKK